MPKSLNLIYVSAMGFWPFVIALLGASQSLWSQTRVAIDAAPKLVVVSLYSEDSKDHLHPPHANLPYHSIEFKPASPVESSCSELQGTLKQYSAYFRTTRFLIYLHLSPNIVLSHSPIKLMQDYVSCSSKNIEYAFVDWIITGPVHLGGNHQEWSNAIQALQVKYRPQFQLGVRIFGLLSPTPSAKKNDQETLGEPTLPRIVSGSKQRLDEIRKDISDSVSAANKSEENHEWWWWGNSGDHFEPSRIKLNADQFFRSVQHIYLAPSGPHELGPYVLSRYNSINYYLNGLYFKDLKTYRSHYFLKQLIQMYSGFASELLGNEIINYIFNLIDQSKEPIDGYPEESDFEELQLLLLPSLTSNYTLTIKDYPFLQALSADPAFYNWWYFGLRLEVDLEVLMNAYKDAQNIRAPHLQIYLLNKSLKPSSQDGHNFSADYLPQLLKFVSLLVDKNKLNYVDKELLYELFIHITPAHFQHYPQFFNELILIAEKTSPADFIFDHLSYLLKQCSETKASTEIRTQLLQSINNYLDAKSNHPHMDTLLFSLYFNLLRQQNEHEKILRELQDRIAFNEQRGVLFEDWMTYLFEADWRDIVKEFPDLKTAWIKVLKNWRRKYQKWEPEKVVAAFYYTELFKEYGQWLGRDAIDIYDVEFAISLQESNGDEEDDYFFYSTEINSLLYSVLETSPEFIQTTIASLKTKFTPRQVYLWTCRMRKILQLPESIYLLLTQQLIDEAYEVAYLKFGGRGAQETTNFEKFISSLFQVFFPWRDEKSVALDQAWLNMLSTYYQQETESLLLFYSINTQYQYNKKYFDEYLALALVPIYRHKVRVQAAEKKQFEKFAEIHFKDNFQLKEQYFQLLNTLSLNEDNSFYWFEYNYRDFLTYERRLKHLENLL